MSDRPAYCPRCGEKLTERVREGRPRRYCPTCEQVVYRNAKPAAGVVVVDGTELLLVERSAPPGVGTWSVPAGYLEHDEPPAVAAVRELREETGLAVPRAALSLHDVVYSEHGPEANVVLTVYRADAAAAEGPVAAGDDAADAAFWELDALAEAGETVEPGVKPTLRAAVGDGADGR